MAIVNGVERETLKERANRHKRRAFRFERPANPVPAQIQDAGEYRKFFGKYRDVFVPYAGTNEYTSHSLLAFLIALKDLSPTKSAVLRGKKSFAIGGPVEIVRRYDPVFAMERNDELSEPEKERFYDFVNMLGFHGIGEKKVDVRQFGAFMLDFLDSSGDGWIEIVKSETMGQKAFNAYLHHPTHCLYVATEKDQPRAVAVSPIWREDYLLKNGFDVLPVYPNWISENGVSRTMFHYKTGNHLWYGRPRDLGCMMYQYFEFQNVDYLTKVTASMFMGQSLIETEGDNPEAPAIDDGESQKSGFDDFADQFEHTYTNVSDRPMSVVITERPYGARPAFVFQFTPNTNQDWFRVTGEEAERQILKANNWPKRFAGIDAATGISTNIFLDEFEIHSVTTISDEQELVSTPINNVILKEAAEFFEMPEMLDYSIEFSSPFTRLLKERKENAANDNNSVGSGPVQPGE